MKGCDFGSRDVQDESKTRGCAGDRARWRKQQQSHPSVFSPVLGDYRTTKRSQFARCSYVREERVWTLCAENPRGVGKPETFSPSGVHLLRSDARRLFSASSYRRRDRTPRGINQRTGMTLKASPGLPIRVRRSCISGHYLRRQKKLIRWQYPRHNRQLVW